MASWVSPVLRHHLQAVEGAEEVRLLQARLSFLCLCPCLRRLRQQAVVVVAEVVAEAEAEQALLFVGIRLAFRYLPQVNAVEPEMSPRAVTGDL